LLVFALLFLFFSSPVHRLDLPSFPTRRSSDLVPACNVPSRSPLPALAIAPETKLGTASRMQGVEFDNGDMYVDGHKAASDVRDRSEERFSRNAETDLVCRLLLEKKKKKEDIRS